MVDFLSLTTGHLKIYTAFSEDILATGTGFLYQYGNKIYMITNAHNVTGLMFGTNKPIGNSAGVPVKIVTSFFCQITGETPTIGLATMPIQLYLDTDYTQPDWLMHPTHGHEVDVVALEFIDLDNYNSPNRYLPINKLDLTDQYDLKVSDDLFILGYPFNFKQSDSLPFPIWKRGTIATEPSFDYEGLPKYLVDTASRTGMSGSPVVMKRNGPHFSEKFSLTDRLGTIRAFAGVYSGRIGVNNDFEVQLGIVWKPTVIEEIIAGNKSGDTPFKNK